MDFKQYKGAIEALLFANAEPISAQKIAEVLEIDEVTVERLLQSLKDELELPDHGLCLLKFENRYQLSTKAQFGEYIKTLLDRRRNTPLSPAALECLAIIAYNQPVSRAFIEQVRGVDSSSVVQGLTAKGLIEEAGRLDLPGRPISYRTTDVFLRSFGLSSLDDLPSLRKYEQEGQLAEAE